MFIVLEVLQQVEHFLRVELTDLSGRELVALAVVGTVKSVLHQGVEVAALVQFGIHAGFLQLLDAHLGHHRVDFGVLHHVFEQGQGFRHVLTQAVQSDGDVARTHIDIVVAGEFVELLLDFLVAHLVGAEIFKVIGGSAIAEVGFVAKVIAES